MNKNIIDRQTMIISVELFTLTGNVQSIVQLPVNLRFAAEEMILKSITYNNNVVLNADISSTIQIWCNITNDNLIGTFPNSVNACYHHNDHFRINNNFQTGNLILQFQQTSEGLPASYNPQSLISAQNPQHTYGNVSITIEFVKYAK